MPVFSFKCKSCGNEFTKLIRSEEKDKLKCPSCDGQDLQQVFRPFSYVKITQKYDPGCKAAPYCVSAKRFGCGKYRKNTLPEIPCSELGK